MASLPGAEECCPVKSAVVEAMAEVGIDLSAQIPKIREGPPL